MQLTTLFFHRTEYGSARGQFTGSADFKSAVGSFKVELTEQTCAVILAACEEEIQRVARELLEANRRDTLQPILQALPAPSQEKIEFDDGTPL